jgi:uncharacterized SAM-binding protein YcdF (DUF218 family)
MMRRGETMLDIDPGLTRGSAEMQSPALRPSRLRRLIAGALGTALLAVSALGAGFVWFVNGLAKSEVTLRRGADGIVVLTGRASRIGDAIELLATGRGKRLLITGVYPTTTAAAIARLVPEHQEWFSCCVDLDHSAVNTVGNAIQTRRWVKKHNIKSLIVVTSNYHMPRALTELAHQLSDVTLIAFPVLPDRVRVESWWSNPATAKLLFAEYLKYLRAEVRTKVARVLGKSGN